MLIIICYIHQYVDDSIDNIFTLPFMLFIHILFSYIYIDWYPLYFHIYIYVLAQAIHFANIYIYIYVYIHIKIS